MTQPDVRRTSVLLADDDPRFRALVRSLLEDDGYQVVAEASSATEAVRAALRLRPDVVLLDLVMPELGPRDEGSDDVVIDLVSADESGLRAASQLRQGLPDARIVVLSSLFDLEVQRSAAAMGVGYVEKMAGIAALEAAIASAPVPGR